MRFRILMLCILFCSWYPTFCFLAGVDGTDDSPTPPKAIDPALGPSQDIYGNDTYPGVDGVNIWPMLMAPAAYTSNLTAAHPTLILSHEVILIGDYKLLTAERGNTHQGFFVYENGWQTAARPGPTDPVCGFARKEFSPMSAHTANQTSHWRCCDKQTNGDGFWEKPGKGSAPAQTCGVVPHGECSGENCQYSPLFWNMTVMNPCLFDL